MNENLRKKHYHKPRPKKAPVPIIPSARAQAQALLGHVLGEKLTVDEALLKAPLAGEAADQRFTMLLILSTLQHLGQIDALLKNYLDKPLPAKRLNITNALRLGVTQLLLLGTPGHAAVNETVTLVKRGKDAGLAGLVNAVLQKIVREKPVLPDVSHNLPDFLRQRWEKNWGKQTVAVIAQVASNRAPLDIASEDAMEGATRLDKLTVRFTGEHPPVESLPGYDTGAFFVQDVAASYPVRMLGNVKERQVLDICAAPGGKAMQLIRAGAFVTAIDRSAPRLRVFKANMKRMGMEANSIAADALEWQPKRAYDAILLDAPCTATGTWRRHPEVVSNVDAKDIAEMALLQQRLLERAWEWLKPGGKLVYCVCSLEPEEGEEQAAWFISEHKNARVEHIRDLKDIPPECITEQGYLRTLPSHKAEVGGMDGFFAVCFGKL